MAKLIRRIRLFSTLYQLLVCASIFTAVLPPAPKNHFKQRPIFFRSVWYKWILSIWYSYM